MSQITEIKGSPDLLMAFPATLAISKMFQEPFSDPKFLVLIGGLIILFLGGISRGLRIPRWAVLSIFLFSGAVAFQKVSWAQTLLGISSSNEGWIFGISMIALAVTSSNRQGSEQRSRLLLITLETLGMIIAIVAILQKYGRDLTGTTDSAHPISLLGNQDYVSSFLGFAGTAALCFALLYSRNLIQRVLHLTLFTCLGVSIIQIGPLQGIVAEVISFLVLVGLFVHKKSEKLAGLYAILILVCGTYIGFGYFGIGPLGVALQQVSLVIRTFLWRCALLMWIHNPLIGVGIDGYQDNFRKYRDSRIVEAFSTRLAGQNAHNFVLQELSTVGILGFCAFAIPIVKALKTIFLTIFHKRYGSYEITHIILFLNALLIMLISPGVLTNSMWFWIFSGFLIQSGQKSVAVIRSTSTLWKVIAAPIFLGLLVYAFMPPIDVFRSQNLVVPSVFSQQAGDRVKMYMAVVRNPFAGESEFLTASNDLIGLHRVREARDVLQIGTIRFPMSFDIRRRLWLVDSMLNDEKATRNDALVLRNIDPLNVQEGQN